MNIDVISANTDLGVNVDGAFLGPDTLVNELNLDGINEVKKIYSDNAQKDKTKENKKKNLKKINEFNERLYNVVENSIQNGSFPLTVGGDHSMAIASALASTNKNGDMGIIWIDAHGDYNTFDTTITGNIHGLPLAAISGYEQRELTEFHNSKYYNPQNTVVVGGRDIDPLEVENLKDAGVTVFTTEDIRKKGMKNIMNEAIAIASNNTNGIHISYDLDVIDPSVCPGVSVPACDGISLQEAFEARDCIIENKEKILSMDLVEYNPLLDHEDKTKKIALNILNGIIEKF